MTDSTAPDRPLPGASFGVAYARFWQRAVVFSGRASRSEYWWAALANALVGIAIGLIAGILFGVAAGLENAGSAAVAIPNALAAIVLLILVLFSLAQILPTIAVGIRRLHDADLSGWFLLLSLIPSVGGLIVLVLHVLPPNPAGRRYDRGATAWAPAAPAPAPAYRPAIATPAPPTPFDAWPAPEPRPRTETAPLPAQAPEPAATDAVRAAWTAVGSVTSVDPRLSGQPSWRRVGYLLVDRADGIGVLTTNGLAASEGAAALGPGAEVYLASTALASTALASTALAGRAATAADGWEFALVASVARRIGASGMHLPAELEHHRALSMAVPVATAPVEWKAPDGSVGVLLGVPTADVPEAVATPAGEVRLVGVVPLRPAELERILTEGRDARAAIAEALTALPATVLASPDRPAV